MNTKWTTGIVVLVVGSCPGLRRKGVLEGGGRKEKERDNIWMGN